MRVSGGKSIFGYTSVEFGVGGGSRQSSATATDPYTLPDAREWRINSLTGAGNLLPVTEENDGSYITLPTSGTGTLVCTNANGATRWTKARTDINAAVDSWTGVFWYDTADDAIWVWAYDTGTAPDTYYLAKVAISDGAITNIGTCQPGDGIFLDDRRYYYAERAAHGSGNLHIHGYGYEITLSTVDGSITSAAAALTQNGIALPATTGYEIAAGGLILGEVTCNATNPPYVYFFQHGALGLLFLEMTPNKLWGVAPYINGGAYVTLWGTYVGADCVAVCCNGANAAVNPRFFLRTVFDAYLNTLQSAAALPIP